MTDKIVFVGANVLLESFIKNASEVADVTVCEESDIKVPEEVKVEKLKKGFFGLHFCSETSVPFYMVGLGAVLKKARPDKIIVMDFIRLWYWQVMWYRFWNSKAEVIVYVETQRVPRGIFHRLAFHIFVFFFRATERMVSIYAVYTDLGRRFANSYGVSVPVVILPVPVDIKVFIPKKEKIYMKDGKLRVLLNARYVPYKRHVDTLKALLLVIKEHNRPVYLTCIGRDGDQALIEREVKRLNLEPYVEFLEACSREKMTSLYQSHDVLVLPSDGEAIGMVVPEAMACGLPTITSDTVGANVYVNDGISGFIFPTGDVPQLAKLIERFLNRELGLKMGESARDTIEHFSEDSLSNKFKSTLSIPKI